MELLVRKHKNLSNVVPAAQSKPSVTRIATAQGAPLDLLRLIVRNLAFEVSDDILRQTFRTHEVLSCSVMRKPNGRSKGFGFAKFASMAEAKRARDQINGSFLYGRPLQVEFAQLDDKYSESSTSAASLSAFSSSTSDSAKLSVTNASAHVPVLNQTQESSQSETKKRKGQNMSESELPSKIVKTSSRTEEFPLKKVTKKQEKNQVKIFNKLISQYGQNKDLGMALKVFARMKRRALTPSVYTYSALINAAVRCGDAQQAQQLMCDMQADGVKPNEVTFTTLMKGLCSADRLHDALALLPQVTQPNSRTFLTLLRGAVRVADGVVAESIFAKMVEAGFEPDEIAYDYLIKSYCYSLQTEKAWEALHKLSEILPSKSPEASLFSLLAVACALSGDADLARKALMAVDRVLTQQKQALLMLDTVSRSSDSASGSHAMFERLSGEEIRREIDRVRHVLITNPDLTHVVCKYGSFLKCPRICFLPSDNISRLNWHQAFAPLVNQPRLLKSKDLASQDLSKSRLVRLEVCSGHGDWVVSRAEAEPDCNWVAMEIRRDRVFQIWSRMVFRNLDNLLIICGDAGGAVKDHFEDESLDEIYINFPEPPGWPGSKLRLINKDFLLQIHRCLKTESSITVVTDDEPYAISVAKEFAQLPHIYTSAFGSEAYISELPTDYGRASYFDRMWSNGRKSKRFFLKYFKYLNESS